MGKDKKAKKGKQEADFGEEEVADNVTIAKPITGTKKGKKGKGLDDLDSEDISAGKKSSQVIKENEEEASNKTKKGKKKGKNVSEDEDEDISEVKATKKKGKEKKGRRRNDASDDEDMEENDVDGEESKKKNKDRKSKNKEEDILSDNEDTGRKNKKKTNVREEVSDEDAPPSKSEPKGKKKKGKPKKVVEDSDESQEEDDLVTSKNKGKKDDEAPSNRKVVAKSGFQMLEIEDMDIDDQDDDKEEEVEVKVVEAKKETEKKGKKSKKERRKKDDDNEEDLDKILAELALEIEGNKPAGQNEAAKVGAAATTTETPAPAQVEAKGKKKKGKKEATPEESVEGTAAADQEEEAGTKEDEEEAAGMKSAAQKKKEKKERERLKKLQQNQLDKTKKQKKPDQAAEVTREESQEKEATPAPMDVDDAADEKDDADDDDKGKKKKKKGKKVATEDEKADKKKPGKKAIAAMQEALKKLKEEEEKRRLEEEEKEKAAEEAERRRLEKIRLEEERKERKKQKEKEKRERLKAEGKLLSKSQKQARARAEATLEALRLQGVVLPPVGGAPGTGAPSAVQQEKRGPRLGDRRRGPQKKKQEENSVSPLQSPAVEAVPQVEVEVVGPKQEPPTTPTTPSAEQELEVKESWDDDENTAVKEAWDESSGSEKETDSSPVDKVVQPSPVKISPTKPAVVKSAPPASTVPLKDTAKPKVEKSDEEDDDEESEEGSSSSEEDEEESDESSEGESSSDSSDDSDDISTKRHAAKTRMTVLERIRKRKDDAEKKRTTDKLRSPVVCVLGHVDTGKTKILDKIRNTHVQDGEAGGITQQIGATMVPQFALKEQCKMVKNFLNLDLKLPGLLIIDTPGHESFSNLRSRGSSLCDIAVLVVDIMHGLEPQTIESLNMLKQRKTPFIVALNKIDRLYEWKSNRNKDVQDVIRGQQRNTKMEFDDKTKEVVLQFNEQGMNVALFHENPDPRTYVSIVPTSAATGDGMGNLMALVVELSQNVMAKKLAFSEDLQATVLEVKAIPGLGTTIDVILVNGRLHEGDTIVVAGHDGPVVTQIRSLLMPQPLKELRVKNPYQEFKEVEGAQGVKIAGKDLDKAIAGLQLLVAQQPDEVEILRDELYHSLKEVMNSIKLSERGVYVQASTLGSLEALLEFLRTSKIPYSGIRIGPVVKKDVMKASIMLEHDNQYAVILAFDVKVERDAQDLADSLGVRIFQADIIYHLFDKFTGYREELKQKRRDEFKHIAVFPCRLRILPQFIFNSRDPIVVGVSVEAGVLREGTPICIPTKEFLEIGSVTTIEVNHKQQDSARKGQEVCIKIEPLGGDAPKMYGRHFDHTDALVSKITRASIDACKEHFRDDLQKADWQLMVELKKLFQIL